MPRSLSTAAALVLSLGLLGAGLAAPFSAEPALAGVVKVSPGVDYVTGRIICDCGCSNLTVKNCTCGRADQIRADVAARLARGQTPEQVLKSYVDEYGEQILASPDPEGFNLVGWLLPFGAVLVAGVLLVLLLRRWARVPWREAPLVTPLESTGSAGAPDPSFLKRVQEDLEETER